MQCMHWTDFFMHCGFSPQYELLHTCTQSPVYALGCTTRRKGLGLVHNHKGSCLHNAMDRFQWLECQPWLLPSGLQSSEVIEWVFHGFASFYVPLTKWGHSHYTEGEEEKGQEAAEEDHLSETASHLRFAAQSSLLHPDQMVKLFSGIAWYMYFSVSPKTRKKLTIWNHLL